MIRLFEKASDSGVRIMLPVDFQCCEKPALNSKGKAKGPSSNMGEKNQTGDSGQKEEEKKVTSALDDTQGTNASKPPNSVDEFVTANPEQHWSDVCYNLNKVHCIDLEDRIHGGLSSIQS